MICSSCATYDNYKCKTSPHNANPSKLPSRNPHGCFLSFISRMLDLIIFLQFIFLYMLLNCFGNDLDFVLTFMTNHRDWVAQTPIKFKSQLNLKCKLILCTFQVNLSPNGDHSLNFFRQTSLLFHKWLAERFNLDDA